MPNHFSDGFLEHAVYIPLSVFRTFHSLKKNSHKYASGSLTVCRQM